jgi:RNA polymerase sigma-70 factor (sigma-E family)
VDRDEAGFEAWVLARRRALARSAYLLTGDVHLAEDLVQDTLARVADRWRKVHGRPDAYARTVMHHLAIDRWRRRKARPPEVLTDRHPELGGAGDRGPDVERRLVLRDALARLTPKQRAVLSLRYYDDLTEVQAAAVLGCSVNTVKSQSRAALERLRVLAPDLLSALVEEGTSS